MTNAKSKNSAEVSQALMEELLNAARVYRLSSYGWLNANDADPDLVGHAMWQVDPPVGDALFEWTHNRNDKPPPETTERQQLLAVSGADFEGLMGWARLSIGMLLVEAEQIKGHDFADEVVLELHRASAIVFLSTASDRIRDFFIAAVFGCNVKAYGAAAKNRGEDQRDYRTPFSEALTRFGGHDRAGEPLRKIQPLADEVRLLRRTRNVLVHELATEAAIRERKSFRTKPQKAAFDIDFATLQTLVKERRNQRDAARSSLIEELAAWYDQLVRVSSSAFEVENALRPRA